MADEMDLKGILTRKVGPAPVWVYAGLLILIGAWWIARRKKAQQSTQSQDSGTTSGGVLDAFALAYPMPYQSDTFVTVQNPPPSVPVQVTIPERPFLPSPTPAPVPAPAPSPIPAPAPPPAATNLSYVVQRGDTLWSIATRFLGSGSRYSAIYQANKSMIEAVAHQHGFASSQGGHWIWPGEKLVIPR